MSLVGPTRAQLLIFAARADAFVRMLVSLREKEVASLDRAIEAVEGASATIG